MQALPDAILVHRDEEIVFVNPATVKLLGATEARQLLGRSVFEFIHPAAVETIQNRIRLLPTLGSGNTPIEHCMVALDGSLREVEGLSMEIRWRGEPAIEVVIRDISERKRAQRATREWNKRLELAHQSGLRIGLWEWELSTNTVKWSDESYRQFGFTREEFSGRAEDALNRIHSEDLPHVQKAIEEAIATHGDYAAQYRLVHPDGAVCWVDARGSVVENGSTKMIGIGIDVTDIKMKEESLRQSEENYRLLLNSTAEGIFGLDLEGNCTFCNPSAARMFGYERPDELLGTCIHAKHHGYHADGTPYPVETCLIYNGFRRGTGTHSDKEYFYRLDGSRFPVEYWSHPVRRGGEMVGCVVTFLDITRRRKAEEQLRESAEHYRLLFNQNPQPMWVFDLETMRFLAVNQAAIERYGYSREEFMGMTICDIRPEEDLTALREVTGTRKHGVAGVGVWRHRTKDGSILHVDVRVTEIEFEGRPARLVLSIDVTESLKAEEALRASEESYREFIENANFGLFRSRPNGELLEVNPALVSLLGYDSKRELLERNLNLDIYEKPEDRTSILDRVGSDHRVHGAVANWRKKDGSLIVVRMEGKEIRKDGEVSHYEVIVEDITERRQLEDQLLQSQKMEAVGRLAGGVAHDFNNALGVITGYSELLQFKLTHDETLHRQAGEIFKAGQKAAALTRQLLAFSRKQTMRPQVLNLNSVVRDIDKMLRRLIGENIDLVNVLASDLAQIKADPGQLEQVLMNLAVNARDAMPAGGKLRIETTNSVLDEIVAQHFNYVTPGRYVMLSVSDTGCGMSEEIKSKIFEPFFTTKEEGRGTGLGLSTVYGIIKQSGGYVWVESEVGVGTRFDIYLPTTNDTLAASATEQKAASIPLGSETILLVEDESALLELAASALKSGGYRVLEAGSAESALELAERHGGKIHLLVTDVILPGMTGPALASRLGSHFPEIKTIFMSGYTDDLLGSHNVLGPDVTLLEKPFSNRSLLAKVRAVLD